MTPFQNPKPFCKFSQTWTKENIREDFLAWLQKVSEPKNVFWLQPENLEPLDLKNPTIEISILPLLNRATTSTLAALVRSWHGDILVKTIPLEDGQFRARIPADFATHNGKCFIFYLATDGKLICYRVVRYCPISKEILNCFLLLFLNIPYIDSWYN